MRCDVHRWKAFQKQVMVTWSTLKDELGKCMEKGLIDWFWTRFNLLAARQTSSREYAAASFQWSEPVG